MTHVPLPIRSARVARGMTQSALAAACGIPLRTLAAYERGHLEPPVSRARAIACALGTTLDGLFGEDEAAA